MKRVMLLVAIVFLIGSCTELNDKNLNKEDDIGSVIHATIESFRLKEAIERADLVAEVIIKEKIEEVTITGNALPYTVFSVEVIDTYQGNAMSEVITIKQQGISERLVNNISLFETGEKYVFFLKETKDSQSDYWILGEETGFFKVINRGTIVKLRHSISEHEDVEVDNVNTLKISSSDLKIAINEQVLNKPKFINKITNIK